MILALQRRLYLPFESIQVVYGQSTLLTDGQMIDRHLKIVARKVAIDIFSRLFSSQMSVRHVRRRNLCFTEYFRSKGEECRVAVHSIFDLASAGFTFAHVIRYQQQFRNW